MVRLWLGSGGRCPARLAETLQPEVGFPEPNRGERPVRGERDAIDELERLDRTDRENISGL
jgi:hypothetical protein